MRALRNARERLEWWLIASAWMVVITAIWLWLSRVSNSDLRDQLRRWQFWSLELQFLLLLLVTWINLPDLIRSLALRARDLVFPSAAAVLALALTMWVAPQTNRIYYDEQVYQSIGQNLGDLRLAQMCNDGTVEYGALQCRRGLYNKEPYGYPYLLSVAYRLVGVHEGVAFAVNTLAAALSVLAVFLVTTALTGSVRAGRYASLVAALIPDQLRWSHSAAAEPSAALACLCAVLTALAFVRVRSTRALVWMVVTTVFAAQFRPECVLVIPLVLTIVLLRAGEEFKAPRLWWAGCGGLALAAVHVGHLLAVSNEGWGASGARFSVAFVKPNLLTNAWFYLGDMRFPVVYSGLALAAVVVWRETRTLLVPVVYFLLFWGIFLFFYAGSYNYGADDRFSLMTYPPLAILAGIGMWRLIDIVSTRAGLAYTRARNVMATALCLQFLWYVPFVRAVGEEAWGARADVAFARRMAGELPPNSILLTQNPTMFHVWGYNAAQASFAATETGYVENALAPRYAGGIFFHWNFWCNVDDPVQQAFCTDILTRFPHTLIREYRERDYRYAIYRLEIRPARHNELP